MILPYPNSNWSEYYPSYPHRMVAITTATLYWCTHDSGLRLI